jgi:hypothetical protein
MSDTISSYELGWSDGYAEGYACKLQDVTESFMPKGSPAEIEAVAIWLQRKYSLYFSDRKEAIVSRKYPVGEERPLHPGWPPTAARPSKVCPACSGACYAYA